MGKYSYGLQVAGLKIGAVGVGGGAGTVLTSPGQVRENTIKVTPATPTKTQFTAEGENSPAISIAKRGITTIAFDLMTFDKQVIADLTGGTTTGAEPNDVYKSPVGNPVIEKTIEITDAQGVKWTFPRCNINASLVGAFTSTEINVVRVEADVLAPTDGSADFIYGNPA